MALHRELFNDLPDAAEIRKGNEAFLADLNHADGFYIIVQDIAEKYGEKAYALAEDAFRECGMRYDPAALRTPGLVRRVGYLFEGANVYDITIKEYTRDMAADAAWLYNREIRELSRDLLLDAQSIDGILSSVGSRAFVAYNPDGQRVGFVHCCVRGNIGSVEAMAFLPGRIHLPCAAKLAGAAKDYFKRKNVDKIVILQGYADYPYYRLISGCLKEKFESRLPHIHAAVDRLQYIK